MPWEFFATATQFLLATEPCANIGLATGYPFTISTWVYTNSTATQTAVTIATSTATAAQHKITLNAGGVARAETEGGGVTSSAASPNNVVGGQWNHIGAQWVSNVSRIVTLNGGSEGTNATSGGTTGTILGLTIGASHGLTIPMNGKLADLAIWNVQLSLQELKWLAKGNSPLLLKTRLNNLRFYRGFNKRDYNEANPAIPYTKLRDVTGTRGGGEQTPIKRPRSRIMWAWLPSSSAITTLLTLTAGAVATAIENIRVGKITPASDTGSSVLVRGVGLSETTTVIGVSGNINSVGKLLAANVTGTATLSFSHVINLTLAAAATVIATVNLQIGKLSNAASSALASILKSAGLNETTTVVGISGDVLSVGKLLAASAVGTATLSFFRLLNLLLTASVTVAASVTLQVGKSLSSSASALASLANSISTSLTTTVVAVSGRVMSVGKNLGASVSASSSVGIGHFLTLAAQVTVLATVVVKFIPFTPGTAAKQLLQGLIRGLGKIGIKGN